MPLALLENISDTYTLALWKIEETVETLIKQSDLEEDTLNFIQEFHLDKRKIEWLCVRILIKEIFGKTVEIQYAKNGKPFVNNEEFKISISHSKDFVGVIVSKKEDVGLDIEYISSRIERIKLKFLSSQELKEIPKGENYQKQMLLYWCSKEAMMKICGNREIDFIKQLKVHSFVLTSSGKIAGEIFEKTENFKIDLNYFEIDNSLVVWGHTIKDQ